MTAVIAAGREPNRPAPVSTGRAETPGNIRQIMSSDGDTPSRWWALAAEARAVSAEMTDPQAIKIMLAIAAGYERLARRAEARQKDQEKGKE